MPLTAQIFTKLRIAQRYFYRYLLHRILSKSDKNVENQGKS